VPELTDLLACVGEGARKRRVLISKRVRELEELRREQGWREQPREAVRLLDDAYRIERLLIACRNCGVVLTNLEEAIDSSCSLSQDFDAVAEAIIMDP
jgi:hypothetical protein